MKLRMIKSAKATAFSCIIFLVCTHVGFFSLAQQQTQYTQYMFSGLAINPAYAGSQQSIESVLLSRWQWAGFEGAPNTQALYLDGPVPGRNIGLGLLLSRDQIGVVKQNNVYAAYAYRLPVAKGLLSMGLQAGVSQFGADYSNVYVNDADIYFQQNIKDLLPNFGTGFYYNNDRLYLGFSMPTLINGRVGDSNVSIIYQRRHYFFTGGYTVYLNSDLRLVPSFLLKMVGGSTLSFDLNSNLWIKDRIAVGASYRSSESIDLITQFAVNDRLRVGYSSDYIIDKNLGNLANFSHEFIIGYTLRKKKEKTAPPPPDADFDGIEDTVDNCPNVAGVAENHGCPADQDQDGVPDTEDTCANEPGAAVNSGCPDADADGVLDKDDECPDTAGTLNGCPDSDGDGIRDADDLCPQSAGTAEMKGCPDTDGDGLHDKEDSCPNQPGKSENKGCPEIDQETKTVLKQAIQGVQFEAGSDKLKATSYDKLDKVIEILVSNPDFNLKLSGYSDSSGDDQKNLVLSDKRAKSVARYLQEKGIDPARIAAEGYGEANPVGDNNTAQGRALNRRVEFEIVFKE